jgi:hypothetical protein
MRLSLSFLAFLCFLCITPTTFAAGGWEGTAALAIAASAGFLGVAYAAGIGFGVNELQIMAKEEFYQLAATGLLVVLLVGGNNLLDWGSNALGSESANLQALANNTINLILSDPSDDVDGLEEMYQNVTGYDNKLAKESSKTTSCNVLSIGYSVSACGGFSMLNAPVSMSGGILGFAIGELYSMKRLIAISTTYSLSMILPFGILLRTFKATRGAGGLLIAVAVSMHILLPAGMVFNNILADTFLADPASDGYSGKMETNIPNCASDKVPRSGAGGMNMPDDQGEAAKDILDDLHADLRRVVFNVLVKGTLGPVLSLLMMVAGIRALSSLAGAEVDVTSLGRFV